VVSQVGESSLLQSGAAPLGFNKETFVLIPQPGVFLASFVYTISLTVTNTVSGASGSDKISFFINQPPLAGSCEACNLDYTPDSSGIAACITSGRALRDTFRVSCTRWADEDLPLSYIFGYEISGGMQTSIGARILPSAELVMPTGVVALTAQVVDSLAAKTDVQRLLITTITTGRRQSSTFAIDIQNALKKTKKAQEQGALDQLQVLPSIIAVSFNSAANAFSVPERRTLRASLAEAVMISLDSAAPTGSKCRKRVTVA